jgi:hypothetical protein
LALEVNENFFADTFYRAAGVARLIHYPAMREPPLRTVIPDLPGVQTDCRRRGSG